MKIQRNDPFDQAANCDAETTLSNEAFYLIAIAILLKKESGTQTLLHYLLPGGEQAVFPKIKA
jgi:hypothetical protein